MNKEHMVFCSLSTCSHLAQNRVLRDSVARHHPGVRHVVLLVDGDENEREMTAARDPRVTFLVLKDILPNEDERRDIIFYYTALQLSCAVKPLLARTVLQRFGAEFAVYLDSDVEFFAPLPESGLPRLGKSFLVTPHILKPTSPDIERRFSWGGCFNAGFFAVRGDVPGHRILDEWWRRCRFHATTEYGLLYDQLWFNHLYVYFEDHFEICRTLGINVSSWNLHERPLDQLVLFHWSRPELTAGTRRIFRDSAEEQVGWPPAVMDALFKMIEGYRNALVAAKSQETVIRPYAFAHYRNGAVIEPAHRQALLFELRALGSHSGFDPFDAKTMKKRSRAKRAVAMLRCIAAQLARGFGAARVARLIRRGKRLKNAFAVMRLRSKESTQLSLREIAMIHGANPSAATVFETLFAPIRLRPVAILMSVTPAGLALAKVWTDFFSTAAIQAFDAADEAAISRMEATRQRFDIVIHDARHSSDPRADRLRKLLELVQPGGTCVVEASPLQVSQPLRDPSFLRAVNLVPEDVEVYLDGALLVVRVPDQSRLVLRVAANGG